MPREIKDHWEATAEAFQEDMDRSATINWGWDDIDETELLGPIEGSDIIELGCGGGQCTVALAERGANVVGIDFSRNQLAHAQHLIAEAEHGVDIELLQTDVTDLGFLSKRFDVAFNTWVFQWIDDLQACFEEVHRVLRPDGRFVFSTPHPFYKLVDPETHVVEGSYFETGRWVLADDIDEEGNDLIVFHQPISAIYNALYETGFEVERLLEPGSPDPDDYEPDQREWGEPPELRAKLPRVLIVKARKRS